MNSGKKKFFPFKLFLMFLMICTVSQNKYVFLSKFPGCLMYSCEFELKIEASEENVCTFEAWLSVTIPRSQNSADIRSSMQ